MGKAHKPRSGSMQFWPRKRAKKETARVRSWAKKDEPGLLGFAGYKAGMLHCMIADTHSTSRTKGMTINLPITVIECPPIKAFSIRFYQETPYGTKLSSEVVLKSDKELSRKVALPKKELTKKLDALEKDIEKYSYITLMVYTQPKMTGIGKKKPELFEVALGGPVKEQLAFAKEHMAKEITVEDVFKPGQQLDIHAITTGKGFQGPVKRSGIGLTEKKSEKVRRGPGSLGGWKAQGHFMYRNPLPGQMGYNKRTELNKWLLNIGKDGKEITPDGGFPHYGVVKNDYILVKGSIAGPVKRLIRFNFATRPSKKIPENAPEIRQVIR